MSKITKIDDTEMLSLQDAAKESKLFLKWVTNNFVHVGDLLFGKYKTLDSREDEDRVYTISEVYEEFISDPENGYM